MLKVLKVIIFLIILQFGYGDVSSRIKKSIEICGFHNGHRRYLDLGENGQLKASNISISNVRKSII